MLHQEAPKSNMGSRRLIEEIPYVITGGNSVVFPNLKGTGISQKIKKREFC